MNKLLNVSSSPHVRNPLTTQKIMLRVVAALMPVTVLGIINYGLCALAVVLVSVLSSVVAEGAFNWITKRPQTLKDGSAVVTGLLLALVLPPDLPLYIPALGGVFAIIFAKCLFGGLGHNFMNPALAARCFLLISFGSALTVYKLDGIATATPLADYAAGEYVQLLSLFWGKASGSIGSSVLGILIGAIMLFAWKIITFEIPLMFIGSFALFMALFGGHGFHLYDILLQIMGGGILFGAFFMATDYVTSPVTSKGQLVYGTLLGILCGLFRILGAAPDSVSYAIIFGNLLVPFIDEYTVPVAYGHRKKKGHFKVSILKPAAILGVITLIAGAALSTVFGMTKDTIEAQKLAAQTESYKAVCSSAEEFVSDKTLDAAVAELEENVYGTDFGKTFINQVLLGKDSAGETVGYILTVTSKDGYGGDIVMSVGLSPEGLVTGIEFTEIAETAGMGMLVTEAEFKDQFLEKEVERFVLNKAGGSTEPEQIDGVSGATFSSGAVTNAVNAAVDFFVKNIR